MKIPDSQGLACAVGAENARTGKTMAEKMVKIMEERLKEKAAVAEKLQSKNHALKVGAEC